MSLCKNNSIRCDWCGRLTRNKNGEYRKTDGSAGYIHQPEWTRFPDGDPTRMSLPDSRDICEECSEMRDCKTGELFQFREEGDDT